MSQRYVLRLAGPAAKALVELLPSRVATAAYDFISWPLLDHPHRLGKPLCAPMEHAMTASRGTYQILYCVDDKAGVVEVTAILHRANAYWA